MLELLAESEGLVKTKKDSLEQMREIFESLSDETHASMDIFWKYKDIKYYYGRGWGETSISKPLPDEKFKDRTSPCFRKLAEIVRVCCAVGNLEILDQYLKDMRDIGIDIQIDPGKVNAHAKKDIIEAGIESACELQATICQAADELRDMGEEAENKRLCKDTRFKRLAEEHYKLKYGKDTGKEKTREKMHSEIAVNLLNNRGAEITLGEKEPEALKVDIDTGEIIQ